MELLTTVRDFTREMTMRHLAPDTHIRVIIDESEMPADTTLSPKTLLPQVTAREQAERLNRLPHDANPPASAELVQIIGASHVNTEPLEL